MATRHRALIIASIILISILVGGVYLYIEWWLPNRRLQDYQWRQNASQDELRANCHQVLRFPAGNNHDAYLILADIGNAQFVPRIIRSLWWLSAPNTQGGMECTNAHAAEALRSLTGQELGFEPKGWRDWWAQTGSKMPPSRFFPRHNKAAATTKAYDALHGSTE